MRPFQNHLTCGKEKRCRPHLGVCGSGVGYRWVQLVDLYWFHGGTSGVGPAQQCGHVGRRRGAALTTQKWSLFLSPQCGGGWGRLRYGGSHQCNHCDFFHFGIFNHISRNEPGQKNSRSDTFESHQCTSHDS
jgi:hypothetical protein